MTDLSTSSDAASTPVSADAQAAAPEATTLATGADIQQSADQSAATDTAAEGVKPEAAAENPEGEGDKPEAKAPEAYADFTFAEGVQIDPAIADNLRALSKELDLTQEQAQRIADLGATQAQRFAEQQAKIVEDASTAWTAATKADPEIGGDKLADSLTAGKKALDAFGTPELRDLLNQTRLGNHPEFVRFISRAGKAISDDTFVSGDRSASTKGLSAAEILYSK